MAWSKRILLTLAGTLALPLPLSAQRLQERASIQGPAQRINGMALSGDGKWLATAYRRQADFRADDRSDTDLRLWDVATGKEVAQQP
jgi:hypothetical protein